MDINSLRNCIDFHPKLLSFMKKNEILFEGEVKRNKLKNTRPYLSLLNHQAAVKASFWGSSTVICFNRHAAILSRLLYTAVDRARLAVKE